MSLSALWVWFSVIGSTNVLTDKDTAGGVKVLIDVGVCDLVTDTSFGKLHHKTESLLHLRTW